MGAFGNDRHPVAAHGCENADQVRFEIDALRVAQQLQAALNAGLRVCLWVMQLIGNAGRLIVIAHYRSSATSLSVDHVADGGIHRRFRRRRDAQLTGSTLHRSVLSRRRRLQVRWLRRLRLRRRYLRSAELRQRVYRRLHLGLDSRLFRHERRLLDARRRRGRGRYRSMKRLRWRRRNALFYLRPRHEPFDVHLFRDFRRVRLSLRHLLDGRVHQVDGLAEVDAKLWQRARRIGDAFENKRQRNYDDVDRNRSCAVTEKCARIGASVPVQE